MLDYLVHMSDTHLFLVLSCVAIIVSLISILLIRRFIPYRVRFENNAVIGNTAALISVIYGVLAGLSALYLINNNSYAADAVQREANAVAGIYRDSKWLTEPVRSHIQTDIKSYLIEVINNEWPLMAAGENIMNHKSGFIIDSMTNEIINYKATGNAETLALHDMLDEVKVLYDARHLRIHMSTTQLSPELWVVIFIGTILTLFINYLFGMNVYLHAIIVSAAALMASSMIFLLITLDRPFQGEFAIQPDTFRAILMLIDRDTTNSNWVTPVAIVKPVKTA